MPQYIYLIREREFIRLNEPTYKIGKTKNEPNTRLSGYPKGSEVLLFESVLDCDSVERKIIERFRERFKLENDYGAEYFSGDAQEMIVEIHSITAEERERSRAWCIDVDERIKKLQETVETLVKENLVLRERLVHNDQRMKQLENYIAQQSHLREFTAPKTAFVEPEKPKLIEYKGIYVPDYVPEIIKTIEDEVHNDSLDKFIRFIQENRPEWATTQTYLTCTELSDQYKVFSGITIRPNIFSRMIVNKFGRDIRNGKKINIVKLLKK